MFNSVKLFLNLLLITAVCHATTLTQSADWFILGNDHIFTCSFTITANFVGLNFIANDSSVCTVNANCKEVNECNNNFLYDCDINTRTFRLTIPGSFTNDSYHRSAWQCERFFGGTSKKVYLLITVPISSVDISPNITETAVGNNTILTCKTSAGRPSARIQWYLSDGTNLTTSATQQPACGQCIDKVESTSSMTYIGNLTDHGKYIYCIASNLEGRNKISENATITILYGPSSVLLSPSTESYTVTEGAGSIGPIYCSADCRPNCTVLWNGPSLPSDITYVLNIQNISKNQTGDYQCTASNSVGSLTSGIVTVIVNYGPSSVLLSTSTPSFTVKERSESIGPIYCSADCRPNCTMLWSGPNLPGGTKSILNIQNINRNQAGNYQCTASNIFGSANSRILLVIVNYGPSNVTFNPHTSNYTVNETSGIGPITCMADCRPNCTMTWSGPNILGGDTSVLNLQNINRSQAGDYRCMASNNVSNRTSGIVKVTVNYGPTIQMIEGNTTYSENDTAEFRCHVDSVPKSSIKWKFIDLHSKKKLPDINKQLFKVNGSLLIISPINCLSMGLYSCEANNGIGNIQMDFFNVTVMCAPRLNTIEYGVKENIAVRDNQLLNITAPVIAYPKPWIFWILFQNDSSKNITKDIKNTYNLNRHFSNMYIQNVTQEDVGIYAIYAGNSIGNNSNFIGAYNVHAARRPNKPSNVTCSAGHNYIIVNWQPEFHGGSQQSFRVFYKTTQDSLFTGHSDNISEAGYHPVKISNLQSSNVYLLKVHAENIYNITVSDEVLCNTTEQGDAKTKSFIAVGVGVGVGSAVVIICVVLVTLSIFRRLRTKNPKNDKESMKRSNREGENDELKDNPLYVTSVDDVLCQNDVSSQVSKEKNQDISSKNLEKKKKRGCLYENADDIIKGNENIFGNQQDAKDTTKHYNPQKNKDGLIYADLELAPVSEGQRFVIRGINNRNNYAIIDLSKQADPFVSDDEEES